ncbi:MAG: phosphatidylserine decarboxylase family protein [Bacteroidaceae bacterium]|nr:phosphatidylserine decarboxylase family protein [Bacteroidaceae bacterium]
MRKIRKMRLHREGTHTLVASGFFFAALNVLLAYYCPYKWVFHVVLAVSIVVFAILVNFFRCPIRKYCEDTTRLVIAPADGTVVVNEDVDENEYFHDRRRMVSIFMSVTNVHANWIPCDGVVRKVEHHNGRFMAAWLPKASIENERSTVVIETPEGQEVLVRQVAGALARRIVTYAQVGEECGIDEHMGFIKFGSRVDVFLPVGTEVEVEVGQKTTGNETIIAHLA